MSPFLAHFGGGHSLFSGIALVLAGMLLEVIIEDRDMTGWFGRILIILGVVGVVGSSVPQPWWLLTPWAGSFLAWRLLFNGGWIDADRWLNWARIGFLVVTIAVLAVEIPYVYNPPHLETKPDSVLVIGDSLTAGTFRLDPDQRWSALLEQSGGFRVQTLARPGWRTAQAVNALEQTTIAEDVDVIVVLIGGNDVMLETPLYEYRTALDQLFTRLDRYFAPVYAFEIPLPPLGYRYGRAMRSVTDHHDVRLIPRHRLMTVMTGQKNTLDGVHLSKKGHQKLARTTRQILGGSPTE